MKQFLVQIDDQCARDLERVAPTKERARAEFIRRAIRSAIDLELDRKTEQAYRAAPLEAEITGGDLSGWDEQNRLRRPAQKVRPTRQRK